MRILITGNLGYVGPYLTRTLKENYKDAYVIGYDLGYFSRFITNTLVSPDIYVDEQHYGDVRSFPEKLLEGVDAVVHLAAISNDPIGNKYEEVTLDINYRSTITIAEKAKKMGVKSFIFASSCSVYGFAEEAPRTEESTLNPLTAYAKSKVYSERDLAPLASDAFTVTCLRFATACGISDRLRLDLVLNDFVAGAMANKEITILSDGTPWRPLINTKDMARAILWACERKKAHGGNFLIINTGSDEWNYQVKDLAQAIKNIFPEISISINQNAPPDKRSYKVDFSLFKKMAVNHQPAYNLLTTINELKDGLSAINFNDTQFRNSMFIRLNVINQLLERKIIDKDLKLVQLWNSSKQN